MILCTDFTVFKELKFIQMFKIQIQAFCFRGCVPVRTKAGLLS